MTRLWHYAITNCNWNCWHEKMVFATCMRLVCLHGHTTLVVLMMTSSNGNILRVTGPLCGEFPGHRWLNSPYKGQWRGALMFSLITARINSWVNNCETGDLRRHRAHYDVIGMLWPHTDLRVTARWLELNWQINRQEYDPISTITNR